MMAQVRDRNMAPGNSSLFGTGGLFSGNNTEKRTIGVLEYITMNEGCSIKKFQSDIKNHLNIYEELEINNSFAGHFYKNPQAYGFISVVEDRSAYNDIKVEKHVRKKTCTDIFIMQLLTVDYRNDATKHSTSNAFPYKGLFHLLQREGSLTKEFLVNKFPYITDISKFSNNLDEIESGPRYTKFWDWPIIDLREMNIVSSPETETDQTGLFGPVTETDKNSITITEDFIDTIEQFFTSDDASNLFHINAEDVAGISINKQPPKNTDEKNKVLKRDGWTDRLYGVRSDKKNKEGNPLIIVHHIIPMEFRSYCLENYGVDVDCAANMVCVSPNTHEELHHACNEHRQDVLIKAWNFAPFVPFRESMSLTFGKYSEYYEFEYK